MKKELITPELPKTEKASTDPYCFGYGSLLTTFNDLKLSKKQRTTITTFIDLVVTRAYLIGLDEGKLVYREKIKKKLFNFINNTNANKEETL